MGGMGGVGNPTARPPPASPEPQLLVALELAFQSSSHNNEIPIPQDVPLHLLSLIALCIFSPDVEEIHYITTRISPMQNFAAQMLRKPK